MFHQTKTFPFITSNQKLAMSLQREHLPDGWTNDYTLDVAESQSMTTRGFR